MKVNYRRKSRSKPRAFHHVWSHSRLDPVSGHAFSDSMPVEFDRGSRAAVRAKRLAKRVLHSRVRLHQKASLRRAASASAD